MDLIKYFLITDTGRHQPNPGDVLIGKGIQYLIEEYERSRGRIPVCSYISIFDYRPELWKRCAEEADAVVVCGTPQLGHGPVEERFGQAFYDRLFAVKTSGKKVFNLWAGFCQQGQDYTVEAAVANILNAHRAFIQRNFQVYDLITARDEVTARVLEGAGFPAFQLIDSVAFSPCWYRIPPGGRHYHLLVTRNVTGYNEAVARRLAATRAAMPGRTLVLCHTVNDYHEWHPRFPDILCVNAPRSLVEIYSYADTVISLRVHGSVLAAHFGCKLLNVCMDSRSNILDYLGVETMRLADFAAGLETEPPAVEKTPLAEDRVRFLELFDSAWQSAAQS